MRINKYLDELQAALRVKNDKEMAAAMGWSHSVPSHYRTGKRFMDNGIAGHVSKLIDRPVIEIIAAVEADREEMTGQKSFWTDFFQRTAHASSAALLVLLLACQFIFDIPKAEAHTAVASVQSATDDQFILCKMRLRGLSATCQQSFYPS